MDDQGEKIVFLAREILNEGAAEISAKKSLNVTMTFRALCLTTLLSAASGALVENWLGEKDRPLNRYEKIELQALIFYAAKVKGIDETALRADMAKNAGVGNVDDMTGGEFPAARRYLQERAQ